MRIQQETSPHQAVHGRLLQAAVHHVRHVRLHQGLHLLLRGGGAEEDHHVRARSGEGQAAGGEEEEFSRVGELNLT